MAPAAWHQQHGTSSMAAAAWHQLHQHASRHRISSHPARPSPRCRQARLESGAYTGPRFALAVANDVDQVWRNAFAYNASDNWVHQAALVMKATADKKFEPLVAAAQARCDDAPPAATP
jgi:hypothetical protein